uniref:DUF8039 domain-containing protein n=1 Tax=Setaria viridis TaxID=4556 RepID=A0A4V6Y872_SETVI|nr:hypothetical protein SEVIR_6G139700v2 [Setaria viridis]
MLESKVQSQEERMLEEINRRVAHAVAELAQSGALPNPNYASPSQRLLSSCASTGVPDAQTPKLPVEEQWFPVDAITQRTSCELHAPVGNLTIKVPYESALPILAGQTSHGMKIPPGYASVSVEQLVDSQYEGLELDLPGGDGERTLSDALHGIILWRKRYIIIPGTEPSPQSSRPLPVDPQHRPSPHSSIPSSPTQPAPGPSLPALLRSPSPPHPGGGSDDDNNNTPPRSPSPGLRAASMKEPAAPLKNHAEQWVEIQAEVSAWFKKQAEDKKAREMEPPPVNRRDLNFFIRMEEGAKKRIPLLSNYERALVKADERDKRKGKSSSSGAVPDLEHLSKKDAQKVAAMPLDQQAQVLKFMEETGMGLDECLGQVEPLAAPPVEPRWTFELGKSLVRPELVRKLSTKMYEFHQLYMKVYADSREMLGLKVKPIDFYGEGEKVLWLDFQDIYEVYHHDALDVSLISAWVLMLIQTCRREAYLHIGFMDPSIVNQKQIQLSSKKTVVEVYNFLDKQKFKDFILLPYNFKSHVTIFDSLRKDPVEYQDMLGFAWKQFIRTHKGPFKEKLTWNTDFTVRMKPPGNNL